MKLKTPIVIINFKTYDKATGAKAVKLAKVCEKVAKKTKKSVAVAVQAADINRVAAAVNIPVLAQHVDNIDYGSHTGWVLPQTVKENGAVGTLINHSEHRIPKKQIKDTIAVCKKNKLITITCAKDPNEGKIISRMKPDFVAVEPPELIGGKVSVSTAKPEIITKSVKLIGKNVIVGAGVNSTEDVKIGLKLGAKGVLVASSVTKSNNPEKAVMDLVKAL